MGEIQASFARATWPGFCRTVSSLSEEQALFYASLSGGSASQALVLGDRLDFQKRVAWLQTFAGLFQKSSAEIFEISGQMAKEEEGLPDLLEIWKFWVRDLLVCKAIPEERKTGLSIHDCLAEIRGQARKFSFEQLQDFYRRLAEMPEIPRPEGEPPGRPGNADAGDEEAGKRAQPV